jgi:hypothetical protein
MSDKRLTPEEVHARIVQQYVNAYLNKINNMARETLRLKGKK